MPKFQLVLIVAAVVALVGLDYLHASWSAPTNNPPSGNIATPLNTGGNAQTKSGALGAGALSITGESQFNGTLKFPFRNTSAGALTEWNMQRNDGTGNFNIYLNSNGGKSPTHLTTGYALKELFNPGNGSYIFLGSGSKGSAGSAISWQNIFRIFPDGRIGASQYCDINGNNCGSKTQYNNCSATTKTYPDTGSDGGSSCTYNIPSALHGEVVQEGRGSYGSGSTSGTESLQAQCLDGEWKVIDQTCFYEITY